MPRDFYDGLIKNFITSYMVFCSFDYLQKTADYIVNEKSVEDSVKKYMNKINIRLDKLEREKEEKTEVNFLNKKFDKLE